MSVKKLALVATSGLALAALAASPGFASIKVPKPTPWMVARPSAAQPSFKAPPPAGGVWTPLTHHYPGATPDTPMLLTDGRVMVHDGCATGVWALSPDANGSYINGTWKRLASLPKSYSPLYYGSEVLADGRVIMNGGEYNGDSSCTSGNAVWTNKGAIYDPVTNKWKAVAAPTGWSQIGDAQSAVLPDGGYMLANPFDTRQTIGTFSAAGAPTWTNTGTHKKDRNDEEGWTMLPFNTILTVDASRNTGLSDTFNKTEIYDIATGAWTDGDDTPNVLVDTTSKEIGPAVLIPSGKVFQVGGTPCASTCPGHTAIYDTLTGHWKAGPDIPKVGAQPGDASDGPAVLLPNGNVLIQTSQIFVPPSHFFEWNGRRLTRVSEPADAPSIASFEGRMMILPTGEILWTSDFGDIEVYTTTYKTNPDWAPTIAKAPARLARGHRNYPVSGTRFNGLTQGSGYGDDAQSHTNYPLVRITNKATGHVCYARTHNHSVMGINAPSDPTSTKFDVPATCETGQSTLEVVANGMASPKKNVRVD